MLSLGDSFILTLFTGEAGKTSGTLTREAVDSIYANPTILAWVTQALIHI